MPHRESPVRDRLKAAGLRVCRRCGRAEDVDCVRGAAPCLEPSHRGGFAVEDAEVVFWGLCPACQQDP